jgi:hypothetical protein
VAATRRTSTSTGFDPPDPGDLAFLHHAQELDLGVERQLAQLVEEDGAALGGLEDAAALLGGARERALLVAEQRGLDQLARDGAAVDGDELAGATTGGVDRAGQELLAGAGLALDQDRHVPARGPGGLVEDPGHDRAAVDDVGEGRELGRRADGQVGEAGAGQGHQLGRDVEGHGDVEDAALGRRFDERGREAGLGDQEPDRVHRRGAGAQVEREVDVAAPGQDALAGRDHGLVDLAVFGRSRQRAQVGLDQGVGARREGLLDPGGLARRLVAEDVDLVEAPLADGDGDGPDDAGVAAGRLEVAIAEPGEQDAGHGTKVQRSLW